MDLLNEQQSQVSYGLEIKTKCFTHDRLSAAASAFLQNFLGPVMVTHTCSPRD